MLYIVHVLIDRDTQPQWEPWMRGHHIPEVLATGCFIQCIMARDEAADTDSQLGFRMTYQARDADAMTRYQQEHAPALQRDHTERFAGRFAARRELLKVVERFEAP